MNPSMFIKKYKGMSAEAKASLWYTICNLFQKGIAFIVVPIYTRMITTEEYGSFTVFQSWRDIIIIFATLNLSAGIFTRGLVRNKDIRDDYTSWMQGLGTVTTAVVFVLFWIFRVGLFRLTKLDDTTIILLFIFYLFFPSLQFWSVRQRVENKYIKMVVVTMLVSVMVPVASIGALLTTSLREKALVYGFLIIQALAGLVFYVYHLIKNPKFFNKEVWIESLKFNIPLIPHYLSLIVLGQSDRIMIEEIKGKSDAGFYSLTYNVSQIIIIFIASINGSLVPWMYKKLYEKEYDEVKKISTSLCVLLGVMSAVVIIIAPEVILFMGGKAYTVAKWCVPPVVMGTYFTFCYGLFSTVEFHMGNTKYVTVASCVGAVLNIALNWIFIPIFGFVAAAYTTEVCYLVLTVLHYAFMRKMTKDNIFNMKQLVGVSAVILAISIVFTFTYYNLYVRICVGLALLVVIILNKNRFMSIIGKLKSK